MSRLAGKSAVITGAAKGIGRATADLFATEGARLVATDIDSAGLDRLRADLESRGAECATVVGDVSKPDDARRMIDAAVEHYGRLDILVANAGINVNTFVPDLCEKKIADLMNVNVLGVVNSVSAVLPEMVRRGSGHLVANSSLAAYRGLPKSAAYCASKAAISTFFEAIRIDLRGSGVDVTTIHPGFVKTPLIASITRTPYVMELDYAVNKIVRAIEKRKKGYSFPWQLATIVRAGMLMPVFMYDWIAARNSFRE